MGRIINKTNKRRKNIKTIIIDKLLLHTLDMEHSRVIYSDKLIDLTDELTEYYDKKIEKTLESDLKKEIIIGSQHFLLTRAKDMLENDENFISISKEIAEDIFDLNRHMDEMPNSDILFVECKIDGEKNVLIIKLNYSLAATSITEANGEEKKVKIINQQTLPTKGSKPNEAILINIDSNKIELIEKKFMIDGKRGFYLNSQYIKGEPLLTDKEKLDRLKKVIKKVDRDFNVVNGDTLPHIKSKILELYINQNEIKPIEVAKSVFEDDYSAQEESEMIFRDLGIDANTVIGNIASIDKYSRVTLVLDEDRSIELDVDDYINCRDIIVTDSGNGLKSITLQNIRDVVLK